MKTTVKFERGAWLEVRGADRDLLLAFANLGVRLAQEGRAGSWRVRTSGGGMWIAFVGEDLIPEVNAVLKAHGRGRKALKEPNP